ncbi:hypothetical protein [Nonomuraea sediminis]|uniref:hypothetical protein n=1 Tax=Nonomuraea sediminis TaxID=2835864 RepID=UPI001BDCE272|nr:hypothetical protein [Nonomuraea sediminis]
MTSGDEPYTYVVTREARGHTYRGISFYDSAVRVATGMINERGAGGVVYQRPYVSLGTNDVEATLSTRGGGPVTLADVELAERLAGAADRYLAMCREQYEECHGGQQL